MSINNDEILDEDIICCICFEENFDLTINCETCSAYYHYGCIEKYITHVNFKYDPACPVCKQKLRDMFLPLVHKHKQLSDITLI